ncbi:LytR/AlgR family response regulator transcription factor [Larkinella soli]|uniref:LytR/AlgR family response regulator transcription factor n=1 Tax=Larkinella soli TaxID=1770527 RepID=UPI000FFB28E3|nr:LytTR family DNA-binding domain-containing protein [Larkinella soli]
MNVLIIEDETLTARRLEKLLHTYDPGIRVLARIPSVAKTLRWFEENPAPKPDLIFLDIHLEDDLGFRIIEQLRLTIPIIFTTAYDEYMLQAFKANSIDYLLKPIDYEELVTAIEKFRSFQKLFSETVPPAPDLTELVSLLEKTRPAAYKERFMVTIGPKIKSVETEQIAYFFFEDKATFLSTLEGQNLDVDYSLDRLAGLLNPRQFFRVNRSFLVSLGAIRTIHTFSGGKLKLDLHPKPRQEVFVSGDRVTDFKEWLGR